MRLSLTLFFLLCTMGNTYAQQEIQPPTTFKNKGKFYAYWGWNRAKYTDSDIHFKGEKFDFTLKKAGAKDRQDPFALDPFFNPLKLTIPQTNFKMGYFINDRYSISIGIDHMKYVLVQHQLATISGSISGTGTAYDGTYNDDKIELATNFLEYEHTDGLNYWNLEINRHDLLFAKGMFTASVISGVGAGVLIPRSDVKLLNNLENDVYHLAGYGLSAKGGINLNFFRHFFIQSELKGGFINMPDVRITHSDSEKASQHFYFLQGNIVMGFIIQLTKAAP
jgi:hypothetical protein